MAATNVCETVRCGKRRGNEALLGHEATDTSLTALSHEPIAFRCECDRADCFETVWMVESHFRQVAHSEGISLVAPGHCAEDEHVIATTSGYLLIGRAAPRAPSRAGGHTGESTRRVNAVSRPMSRVYGPA